MLPGRRRRPRLRRVRFLPHPPRRLRGRRRARSDPLPGRRLILHLSPSPSLSPPFPPHA
ncbi:Putative integrase (fragment) [Cupriavidus taiwanensis]|uniref:Integrase n=1 Tax=Cupriavidus taiwanensis TaxID=164546 RepID=A0A976AW30_9BURK